MRIALFAAIAAMFTLVTYSAQAIPAAPLTGVFNPDETVTQIAGGCGPGWHRGPRGRCRRN